MKARLSEDPAEKLRELHLKSYTEEELAQLKPIFISRKPERGVHGAAHEATIRSKKYFLEQEKTAVKTPLTSVKLKTLEDMVGKERDKALYEALKRRLEDCNNDPKAAFGGGFRKPSKDGKPGPVVRSIKVFSSGTSGVKVRGGIAKNGGMVRVDVYTKKKKYYLIPYYVNDIASHIVKNRAITQKKSIWNWTVVDSSYDFVCSLYKYDLFKITDTTDGSERFVYYDGCNISTDSISILSTNGEIFSDKDSRVSIKTGKLIEKYEVDVLGEYHKVKEEKPPHELA